MRNCWLQGVKFLLITLFALTGPAVLAAGSGRYEVSGLLNIVGSSGKPTNDVLGYGLRLHRKLTDEWYLGINLDHSPEFDFERPSKIVGIQSDSEIDAVGSMTMLTIVAERRHTLSSDHWTMFWNLGAGFNEIDMGDAAGDIRGGGSYDIETDTETEFILIGNLGWMQRLGENWSARYSLAAEHHSGDWDVRDKTSGKTGKIDDYAIYGLRIGMHYRF